MKNAISWFELPVTDLDRAVSRVEEAGGRVLLARIDMGDWGVAAFIVDTEGNRVALHATGT